MTEVVVGIDIGTSYTKAVARTADGRVTGVYRLPSPRLAASSGGLLPATPWWECFSCVLRGLLPGQAGARVVGLCVSGIAPTLTLFDAAQPDRAWSLLYSSVPDLPDGVSVAPCDPCLAAHWRTVCGRTLLANDLDAPYVSDLVGYVNWRLTGEFTLNTISFSEVGATAGSTECDMLALYERAPRLVAPSGQVGVTAGADVRGLGLPEGIPVAGGCPDTMASAVGAGVRHASETVLYLGTFGSLFRLGDDVESLLETPATPESAFHWSLSVPGLGPEVESLGRAWFESSSESLPLLDNAAAESPPGAEGTLFMVPRWRNGRTAVGTFAFVSDSSGLVGDLRRRARAVLESVGYAALTLGGDFAAGVTASGGGARSRVWLDALSVVLGTTVRAREMSWEAVGAADIAARMVWRAWNERPCFESRAYERTSRLVTVENCLRAKEWYREHAWF